MRLISARVRGAGRLVDTTIKLDQKVVAVVGPNEAGKTTLLDALAYVEASDALALNRRSRASDVADETPVISLHYRLGKEDRESVADLNLHDEPTEFFVSRRADGQSRDFRVQPAARKSEVPLEQLVIDLGEALDDGAALGPLSVEVEDGEGGGTSNGAPLLEDVQQILSDLRVYLATPVMDRGDIGELSRRVGQAAEALADFDMSTRLRGLLAGIKAWADLDEPAERAGWVLWTRSPDVVMFSEDDRTLATTYTLDDNLLSSVPSALANLARLAELNLTALVEAVKSSQISRRDTIKNKANIKLAAYFKTAWWQSDLTVELNIENTTLRIGLIEDGVRSSPFNERSAGLKMFVALTAFLAARDTGRPTILLIDEAETHLHIDAQADLVQMFAKQDKADKIIYTTHSPGCLPADLGVGIRAVVPDSEETSYVENNFWRQPGGAFTSLMFLMGAAAAAFTPARCAVVAEGATDMILLPTLMRAATGLEALPYQVAPGLSEMPKSSYPELDFQAAKVAFLVDGDGGGERLAKALGRAVPKDRIVTLAAHGIENTLDPEAFRNAFLVVLAEVNPGAVLTAPPDLPSLTERPWSEVMESWAFKNGWRTPSKQEIASHLIQLDEIALSEEGAVALELANSALLESLGLQS